MEQIDLPLDIENIKQDNSLNLVHSDICRITDCKDGYIHPTGFVLDHNKTPYTYGKWYNKNYPAPIDTTTLKDVIAISLIQIHNTVFQHIPFDTFPKMYGIQEMLKKYPTLKLIVNHPLIIKMMTSFFSLDSSIFILVKSDRIYQCKRAIYINHVHHDDVHTCMGSWGCNLLAPWIVHRKPVQKYFVYLSRYGLSKRSFSPQHENNFIKILHDVSKLVGLELKIIINPKNPNEVANVIEEAHTIIGIHGGAFANMIYANPATNIIELISPSKLCERPCFYYLAMTLGLKYRYYEPEEFDFNNPYGVRMNLDNFKATILKYF